MSENNYDIGLSEDLSFRVLILPNGTVIWMPFITMKTSCVMDMTYFPFDKQSCSIRLTSWTFVVGSHKINLIALPFINENLLHYYKSNGIWRLVSLNCQSQLSDNLSIAEISFVIAREPRYFILNIILPTICLSVLSVFALLIQPQAGEKVSVSVTILMSYSVILLMLSDNVPRSDKLPIISKL